MAALLNTLQRLDLHPVADHFTIALLIVGVAIDVIASAAPTRTWLRYMALTLMILEAIAAGASYFSGDMEADRVWKAMGAEARDVFKWHAMLGEYLAIGFGVLALWRILIQAVGFFAGSRPVYLLVAIIGSGTLIYSAHLGGKLVYDYGVGTALMGSQPSESAATPTPAMVPNEALPTVSVPTPPPTPAPSSIPTPMPTPAPAVSAPVSAPTATPPPSTSPAASASPAPTPPPIKS